MKKLLSVTLVLCMLLSLCAFAVAEESALPLEGKVIFLYTNDMHGHVQHTDSQVGYSGVALAKASLQEQGAEVFLFDAGDAAQGAPIVNLSHGAEAINFMNMAGYDAACPGNHEFDWGADNFFANAAKADFPYICANIVDQTTGEAKLPERIMFETAGGFKIGVFAVDTPEAKTKVNPDLVQGIEILADEGLVQCAQAQVSALKDEGAQFIVCLGHLGDADESIGNRSIDLIPQVEGIDLFIDAHSHTYIQNGDQIGNTLRVSTGRYSQALGYTVYSLNTDKEGNMSLNLDETGMLNAGSLVSIMLSGSVPEVDEAVDAYVNSVMAEAEATLGATFARTEVFLNGERRPGVRTEETNLGDFCCDALLWKAKQTYGDQVVAAVTNGGGIRASIEVGDISMLDMKTVFPFGNTIACLEISGADLLEVLEAATFSAPDAIGGFPQVSGIVYTLDTTVSWEQGEQYPDSIYYAPAKAGSRVTIESVGGEPFDPETMYTVATNNFLAAGGDQYYAMRANFRANGSDTGVAMEDALCEYISEVLGGVIGQDYAEPQGRITVIK